MIMLIWNRILLILQILNRIFDLFQILNQIFQICVVADRILLIWVIRETTFVILKISEKIFACAQRSAPPSSPVRQNVHAQHTGSTRPLPPPPAEMCMLNTLGLPPTQDQMCLLTWFSSFVLSILWEQRPAPPVNNIGMNATWLLQLKNQFLHLHNKKNVNSKCKMNQCSANESIHARKYQMAKTNERNIIISHKRFTFARNESNGQKENAHSS